MQDSIEHCVDVLYGLCKARDVAEQEHHSVATISDEIKKAVKGLRHAERTQRFFLKVNGHTFSATIRQVAALNMQNSPGRCISFDVGGMPFHVSGATLQHVGAHSPLSLLPSSTSASEAQMDDDDVFIDRDGHWFALVLQFLRDGSTWSPGDRSGFCSLQRELRYYQLPPCTSSWLLTLGVQLRSTGEVGVGYYNAAWKEWNFFPHPALSQMSLVQSCSAAGHIYALCYDTEYSIQTYDPKAKTFEHLFSVNGLQPCEPDKIWAMQILDGHVVILYFDPDADEAAVLVINLVSHQPVPHALEPPDEECTACVVDGMLFIITASSVCWTWSIDQPWQDLEAAPSTLKWRTAIPWKGQLVLLGGVAPIDQQQPCANVEVYDPQMRMWYDLPPMSTPRCGASAFAWEGGLVVCGGYNGAQTINEMERYIIGNRKWDIIGSTPFAYNGSGTFLVQL